MIPEQNIIDSRSTLRSALQRLNALSGSEMTLIVVDNTDTLHVVGTLTNGDVRRALLGGASLDNTVDTAMHTDFMRLVADKADIVDDIAAIRRRGITLVPVVDSLGALVDVADLNRQSTRLPLTAVLMAGGRGERLRPLTDTVPKPLLEIGGKAIIDYNVEALTHVGISDITVTARYLADSIRAHFSVPVAGVAVKCVTEPTAMGTIGSAALIERPDEGNTLIMNCDLLTSISFEDMYVKHRDTRADVTVAVIPYQVSVPYAILSVDKDRVTEIEEKPSYSHYANAGIYIFSNRLLNTLAADRPTDAPDLIRKAIADGLKVTYHVINGTWIDIGSPTDFRQAEQLMRHHHNLLDRKH